ncbi:hypothetical protein C1H46_016537 [Malus baccata]|uniref:Uncharacterized protein n=1 Tax=Malus baccata TaxID=106549 RepID=A0A540MH01_MALBA|nr:hypothetical protein C1H46_016537 [Malus baccata]
MRKEPLTSPSQHRHHMSRARQQNQLHTTMRKEPLSSPSQRSGHKPGPHLHRTSELRCVQK